MRALFSRRIYFFCQQSKRNVRSFDVAAGQRPRWRRSEEREEQPAPPRVGYAQRDLRTSSTAPLFANPARQWIKSANSIFCNDPIDKHMYALSLSKLSKRSSRNSRLKKLRHNDNCLLGISRWLCTLEHSAPPRPPFHARETDTLIIDYLFWLGN